MGTGVCSSRRQKNILHTGFCLLLLLGLAAGILLYNYVLQKAKASEAMAGKLKQQQETLSAQLQVVYEHRSRLERSLQKERSEHKKTKEDFLVYKLEAQEALNKEKQDSMNRYEALSSQHKILKNQHDDLKKQLSELQNEHSNLKLEHRKSLEMYSQRLTQLQKDKEREILALQDTVFKLREESKLLRKAHNDVHMQLRSAQAQMEEFRQLKDALKKMPSFKESLSDTGNQQLSSNKQVLKVSEPQMRQKALGSEKFPYRPVHLQRDSALLQNQSPTVEMNVHVSQTQNDSSNHLVRLTRMVNSLQIPKETETQHDILQAYHPQDSVVGNYIINNFQAVQSKEWPTSNGVTGKEQVPIQSWQDIVNKVNARMTYEDNNAVAKQEINNGNLQADKWSKDPIHPPFNYRRDGNKEELEMDAGMIDREVNLQPEKQHVVQDALVPDDPAKDPNNQGEDEFEEAEIARPEFEAKANTPKQLIPPIAVKKTEEAEETSREEPEDHYQDDQEQDIEEHGGDLDNAEDLDEYHKRADIKEKDINNKRDDYY